MKLLTKCYKCAAQIVFTPGEDMVRCDSCAMFNDRPKSESKDTELMKYAHERRNLGEFAEAETAYRRVLAKNLGEHEARWGLLLCRRGVVYLKDERSGETVITCRRCAPGSIMTDPDFRQACADAPERVKQQYVRDAEYIDSIQRAIRNPGQQDYDVFICYKETDPETGARTEDSRRALNVFQTLERRGYRVFYAPVSLKDSIGASYEAAIYHAIETAKVMLVLGTKPEYFRTTWMQSEWKRFLEKVDAREPKLLVPMYAGFDAYQLPQEFTDRFIQALNMSDAGYMFDLEDLLNRVIQKENPEEKAGEEARRKEEEKEQQATERPKDRAVAEKRENQAKREKQQNNSARREMSRFQALKSIVLMVILAWALFSLLDWLGVDFLPERAIEPQQIAVTGYAPQPTKEPQHVVNGEIQDCWEEIFASIDDGTYKEKYSLGDVKLLDLGSEGEVYMEIVAFDTDERADGQGKAPITWLSRELLNTERRMNPGAAVELEDYTYQVGTGSIGGWEESELRRVLNSGIFGLIPEEVSDNILSVTKVQKAIDEVGATYVQKTEDMLWVPSRDEVLENMYSVGERVKYHIGSSSASAWWLRSAYGFQGAIRVYTSGYTNVGYTYNAYGVALGFCT